MSLAALTTLLLAASPPEQEEVVMDEARYIIAVLENRAFESIASAEHARGEGMIESARSRRTPTLSLGREQSNQPGGLMIENNLTVQQTLSLSKRRDGQIATARANLASQDARTEALRLERVTRARELFYRTLWLQERIQIREALHAQLEAFEDALQKRVDAGESSPYDLERVRVEIAESEARIAVERSDSSAARMELASWMGNAMASVKPSGVLAPSPVNSTPERALEQIERCPQLIADAKAIDHWREGVEATSRNLVPDPTLGGGYLGGRQGEQRFHGFVLMGSIPLVAPAKVRGERLLAEATVKREENERALAMHQRQSAARQHAHQTTQLVEAAERYRSEGIARAERLLELANQAYEGDEASILAVIDAHRSVMQAKLHHGELIARARAHDIQYRDAVCAIP
ncbi:MAG: TolC family protein [Myxococcota bacterium]|nr:TolC family protein [Myxococcota bacterium]